MQYTIRLLQPVLDPQERQRIAANAASQLGGSAEKLEQLIGRDAGSRIARTGSAQHADRVAGILRAAGLQVEIQPPESPDLVSQDKASASKPAVDSVPKSAPESASMPAPAPLTAFEGKATMIAPASSLPNGFESFEAGHLEAADVFAPPAVNGPTSNNTGASSPAVYGSAVSEPVAVRKPVRPKTMPASEDPFAPPIMDDDLDAFAAPAPVNPALINSASANADPFAAPLAPSAGLYRTEAAQADPFAAYGGVMGSEAVQDDLPKQARRARDRAARRTSVRAQTLLSLIVPLLTVVVALVGYLLYAMPRQMTRLVSDRTLTLSTSIGSQLFRPLSLGQTQTVESVVWQGRADGRASFVYVIAPDNTTILGKATDAGVNRDAVDGIWANDRVALEAQGGIIRAGDTEYVASVAPIVDGSGKRVGSVFTGLEASLVWNEMWSVLTPIFVVLLIVFGAASAIATALSARLLRPIFAATEQANRISLGDLDRRIETTSNDEIGDLLSSLERMRISLKSMVTRLRRAQEQS